MGQIRDRLIKIDMSIVYCLHVYIFLSIFYIYIHITFDIYIYRSCITLPHVYCVAGCCFFPLRHSSKKIEDLDEFVAGCMQLHGPAKSLQRLGLGWWLMWTVFFLGGAHPNKKRGRLGQSL